LKACLGDVCLGFRELSTKISHRFEINGVLPNLALPKSKPRIGILREAPIQVLPAASPQATERVHPSAHIISVIYSNFPLLNLNRYLPVPKRSNREKKEMALLDDSDVLVGRAWRCWMIPMCCDVA
jgi:hypothetical protein